MLKTQFFQKFYQFRQKFLHHAEISGNFFFCEQSIDIRLQYISISPEFNNKQKNYEDLKICHFQKFQKKKFKNSKFSKIFPEAQKFLHDPKFLEM